MSGDRDAVPDVLVLGGGGTLGEAWMTGVLAGLQEARGIDVTAARAFVGTSAGSIVAASLAAGRPPRRPASTARHATPAAGGTLQDAGPTGSSLGGAIGGVARAAGERLAPAALALGGPAGRLVRAGVLRGVPPGQRSLGLLKGEVARAGVRFDGRLLVCAVDRRSGRRVVFGAEDAPPASVPDAVAASCAIPGVFAPVVIDGREYVDGGAWSPTNADVAPVRQGDQVLVLEPTAGMLRGALRGAAVVEAMALRGREARVEIVGPGPQAAPLMSRLMDPDRGGRVLAAGYLQGLALA